MIASRVLATSESRPESLGIVERANEDDAVVKWDDDGRMRLHSTVAQEDLVKEVSMTAGEKKRMLGIVRTVECFFSENIALKSVLTSHSIPQPVWQEECDKLTEDPEHSPEVHVNFQHLYEEIGRARDGAKAFESLLKALPKPKKQWN